MTGTVKWFNNQKGYGFISDSDKNEQMLGIEMQSVEIR